MPEPMDKLLEVARKALDRTKSGALTWHRTGDLPEEYFAHLTPSVGIAVKALRRIVPAEPQIGAVHIAVHIDDDSPPRRLSHYGIALVRTDEGREIASLSSWDGPLADDSLALLRDLFEAAQFSTEGFSETVDQALKALS